METFEKEKAMNIVIDAISQMMNQLMDNKKNSNEKEIKEKIEVLQGVKNEIYKGNEIIIRKVLEKGDINI